MSLYDDLPKPFFVLAPMDDVTDTVFRQIIADCATPDLFLTEFANVDGFQSAGKHAVEQKLMICPSEKRLVAQLWGVKPENFYKTAKELKKRGFIGIDLNMGCPVKNVIKSGACAALMQNRDLAHEIIEATKRDTDKLPVSIKTRTGYANYDESWIRFLLEHKPAMLSVHFRSVKEMSKVDAHWELATEIVRLRDEISPKTLIIGNGDVKSRKEGEALVKKYKVDGIMIGRGIFHDPFLFAEKSPWKNFSKEQKLKLYQKHVELFAKTYEKGERKVHTLNKFCKIYINGFDGAKELREQLMSASTANELKEFLAV